MRLSIIVPVFNEAKYILKVISQVKSLVLPAGLEKEIIIVDDGSWDSTTQILEKYHEDDEVQVHFSRLNFGKGVAIRIGLTYATGDIIIIQDADLEYDPNEYGKILAPLIENQVDVVYGSRFKGRCQNMRFMNLLINKILANLATLLFFRKVTDEATAYKAFKASALQNLTLSCKGFEFCPEVTAKLFRDPKIRFLEVPISYNARKNIEGKKIRPIDGLIAIWTLVKYRFLP